MAGSNSLLGRVHASPAKRAASSLPANHLAHLPPLSKLQHLCYLASGIPPKRIFQHLPEDPELCLYANCLENINISNVHHTHSWNLK